MNGPSGPILPRNKLPPCLLLMLLAPLASTALLLTSPAPLQETPVAPEVLDSLVVAPDEELKLTDTGPTKKGPWKLQDAVGAPAWLEVSGQFRTRFENLSERFKIIQDEGSGQILVLRTLLAMTLKDEFLSLTTELEDSRAYGYPSDEILSTGQVNAVELLQAYARADFSDMFTGGDKTRVKLGRQTMDMGSRRFVARNRYRNTINSFLGANARWEDNTGRAVEAFFTSPTVRLPNAGDQEALRNNEIQFDKEFADNNFWGLFGSHKEVIENVNAELYYYGLDRGDVFNLAVADRKLHTFGSRWYRPTAAGEPFWEIEYAYQFGESRSTKAASNTTDLDHSAYMLHVSGGYAFDHSSALKVEGLFDIATGDSNPNDGQNNRFDSLFGVPRFEFGPTGIFRSFTRANIISPGLRLTGNVVDDWQVQLTQRPYYLESKTDAWTTTGFRDDTGSSGRHVADVTEIRVRKPLLNGGARFEFGGAYLAMKEFAKDEGDGKDSIYTYAQITFSF